MLRSLAPLLGCGLMMLVCMAVMAGTAARNRRNEPTAPESTDEVTALRDEVAQLRRLDEQRSATAMEDPAP